MTTEEFDCILQRRIDQIRATLGRKAEEYANDGDRLFNFKAAARVNDMSPEEALWGMASKHLVSVMDLIGFAGWNESTDQATCDEKIGDLINYLILLEALCAERRAKE